ncbi:hypothetical protein [Mycolicibacterium mageritense]|uniref:hypothetical protein n=1 Tax=Mycolicibacterium mageritense TaxID=53462 RepID=UPI001E42184F|nr:hypothetical protein [Mycolicibacterium mageritense]GJJ24060.1 hypothetical protein MTY414_77340 [Mycolicibacterium mageritense]
MMAANVFAMDAEDTRSKLGAAGLAAQSGVAAGMPTLPTDQYLAPYAAGLSALLATVNVEAAVLAEFGLVNSAASVTAIEAAESENAGQLRT